MRHFNRCSEAARQSEPLVRRLRQGFTLGYAEAEGIDDVTWASLITLPNFVEVEGEGYRLEVV